MADEQPRKAKASDYFTPEFIARVNELCKIFNGKVVKVTVPKEDKDKYVYG